MKKLILALAILLVSSFSYAEEIKVGTVLESIPALKQGVAFSLLDSKLNYLMTTKLVSFGKYVNLEAGYCADAEKTNQKLVTVLSVNLMKVGAIDFPILKYIQFNPGIYYGLGNIDVRALGKAEQDYGLSATLFEVKF